MAPELRKRKSSVGSSELKKTPTQTKRKAIEEGSLESAKKPKSAQKKMSSPSSAKVSKDDTLQLSDSEGEDEDQVQALVRKIDSEDDELPVRKGESGFQPGHDVGKIPKPTVGAPSADVSSGEPGIIYIGRIPHGFYEYEMRQYFSQFGPIKRLRISRNKKTGASKHFAFIEFAEASTAEIAAKTMDNYLLFGHLLKCKTIPVGQIHEALFKGSNRRFKKVPWNKMAGKELEKPLSKSAWEGKVGREKRKREDKAAKLAAIGYSFEAPALRDVPDVPTTDTLETKTEKPSSKKRDKQRVEKT